MIESSLIDYASEHPEFSVKLIPNRGEKLESFIKYGNGLEKKEWGNTKFMGVDIKCSKILEVRILGNFGTVGRNHVNT